MLRGELNLLIEMLKRETEVALRTHFEIFRNEQESGLAKKVEKDDMKVQLKEKVSIKEFWKEIDHIKTLMHTLSREMAIAGISATSSSAAQGNSTSSGKGGVNAALKSLVK